MCTGYEDHGKLNLLHFQISRNDSFAFIYFENTVTLIMFMLKHARRTQRGD